MNLQSPPYMRAGPQHSTKRHKVRRDRGPHSGGPFEWRVNVCIGTGSAKPEAGYLQGARKGAAVGGLLARAAGVKTHFVPTGHSPFKRLAKRSNVRTSTAQPGVVRDDSLAAN